MTRLSIKIKDNEKANIILNLLRELPFVEIEERRGKTPGKGTRRGQGSVADLFGLWEKRDVTLNDIREKAWKRN